MSMTETERARVAVRALMRERYPEASEAQIAEHAAAWERDMRALDAKAHRRSGSAAPLDETAWATRAVTNVEDTFKGYVKQRVLEKKGRAERERASLRETIRAELEALPPEKWGQGEGARAVVAAKEAGEAARSADAHRIKHGFVSPELRRAEGAANHAASTARKDDLERAVSRAVQAKLGSSYVDEDTLRAQAVDEVTRERPWLRAHLGIVPTPAPQVPATRANGTPATSPSAPRPPQRSALPVQPAAQLRAPTPAITRAADTIARSVDGSAHTTRGTTRVAHIARCEGVLSTAARAAGVELRPSSLKSVSRALVACKSPKGREVLASIVLRGAKLAPSLATTRANPKAIAQLESMEPANFDKAVDRLIATVADALDIPADELTIEDAAELVALMKGAADAKAEDEAAAKAAANAKTAGAPGGARAQGTFRR